MGAPGREATVRDGGSSPSSASPGGSLRPCADRELKRIKAPNISLDKWLIPMVSQALGVQMAQVKGAIKDPFRDVRKQVHQLFRDLALTREQQSALERVIACNMDFWDVSVSLSGQGYLPWRRHLGLNLALLRVYHCHLAASTCTNILLDSQASPLPMTRAAAEDALRYCRWMAASYCFRWGTLPPRLPEADLARRAAAVAGVAHATVFASQLSDVSQPYDPLLPRFLIAIDAPRNEVILSIRGTASLSDMFVDLIGNPIPFAGGFAHDGILDAARRLRVQVEASLRAALEQLSSSQLRGQRSKDRQRLVLTGHSLGAGIAELLAIMLRGGDVGRRDLAARWCLPSDVELVTYVYGPAPVYGPDPSGKACAGLSAAEVAVAHAAVESAMAGGVGFAMNYDIIPRTSLHNGYKLFQQARVLDAYVRWSPREAAAALRGASQRCPLKAARARAAVVEAAEAAVAEAAASTPAFSNPYQLQHPAVSQMHHVISAPGGTAASLRRLRNPEAPEPEAPAPRWLACAGLRRVLCPARRGQEAAGPRCSHSGWLWKRSNVVGEWRRRFAWIADGELRIADSPAAAVPKATVPLTAGATVVELQGLPSGESFLPSVVVCNGEGERAEAASRGGEAGVGDWSPTRSLRRPTAWALKVETFAVGGACPVDAMALQLCAGSANERDAWVRALVEAVRAARRECFKVQAATPPEEFGREALLADGFLGDHQVLRYEAAMETLLESCASGESHCCGD